MPSSTAHISRLELLALPTAPSKARRHSNDVLRAWNSTEQQVETAELLISELVTNAVRHAKPDNKSTEVVTNAVHRVVLVLYQYPDRLLVEVADVGEQLPVPAGPNPDTEGGRGLSIIEILSQRWGFYLHPTGGKVVWFELDLVGPLHAAAPRTNQLSPVLCPAYT